MWSVVRSTAARQLRVKVNTGLSVSSRVVNGPASFTIPTSYRLILSSRGFADSSNELAATKAANPTAAKKTTTAAKRKSTATKKGTAKGVDKSKTEARKAAAKKVAEKKAAAKRAAAAKKAAAKEKAAAKKAAAKKPAPKPKKPLTPEQKKTIEVRQLKEVSLLREEPKRLPESAYLVYVVEQTSGPGSLDHKNFGATMKSVSDAWKHISVAERDRLQATALQNRLTNQAAYKAWVASHTPAQVDEANRARKRLRSIGAAGTRRKPLTITDDRLPKRAGMSYAFFVKARWASGDVSHYRSVALAAADLSAQWKALTPAERKPYNDLAAADLARYAIETKSVLNRDVRRASP